jgi:hypothetical protein
VVIVEDQNQGSRLAGKEIQQAGKDGLRAFAHGLEEQRGRLGCAGIDAPDRAGQVFQKA